MPIQAMSYFTKSLLDSSWSPHKLLDSSAAGGSDRGSSSTVSSSSDVAWGINSTSASSSPPSLGFKHPPTQLPPVYNFYSCSRLDLDFAGVSNKAAINMRNENNNNDVDQKAHTKLSTPRIPTPMLQSAVQSPPAPNSNGVGQEQKSTEQKLLDLTNESHYTIVQRNGQRIYGGPPPNWTGPPPSKGCEIFVGKVPRDCFEDELVPVFERVGTIYELRLMMDFSGSNRGYLFVRFTKREEAKRAIKELNNFQIRDGKYLGVVQSVDNRKLWISGIPKNKTDKEIQEEMSRITEGVKGVILYPSQTDKSKTRGYAFIEYESHRAAALARRKLVPGRIHLFGQQIEKVDWAGPEGEVDEEVMSRVKKLFIRNLMPSTTETQIKTIFDKLSNGEVEGVKKTKDYAFVHFTSRSAAETAMANSANLTIDSSRIEVRWSKPVDKQIYNNRKQLTKIMSQQNGLLDHPINPYLNGMAGQPPTTIRGAPGTAPPKSMLQKLEMIRSQQATLLGEQMGQHRSPVEYLKHICKRNNWGNPIFTDVPLNESDLYLLKVTIPCYPLPFPENTFQSGVLKPTMEEAKQEAASFVLNTAINVQHLDLMNPMVDPIIRSSNPGGIPVTSNGIFHGAQYPGVAPIYAPLQGLPNFGYNYGRFMAGGGADGASLPMAMSYMTLNPSFN